MNDFPETKKIVNFDQNNAHNFLGNDLCENFNPCDLLYGKNALKKEHIVGMPDLYNSRYLAKSTEIAFFGVTFLKFDQR